MQAVKAVAPLSIKKIPYIGCQPPPSRSGWAVHCGMWALALLSTCLILGQASQDGLKRGLALSEKGRIAEALLAFDSFKQANPDDPRPYLHSGMALIQAGHLKDAALDLDEAAARGLHDAGDVLAYARARSQLGHLEDASRALAQVEDSTRLDAEGLWYLTDLYYRQKRAQEGLRVLERFAARKPGDPRILLRRGQLLIDLEEFEKALTSLEEAVWADPKSGLAHFEMARTLRYGNNFEAAKKIAHKAVALEPENAEYLHLLGIICDGLKQSAEAVLYLERAAASPDAFARIHFDLGNALRKSGDSAGARKALQRYRQLLTANEAEANRVKTVQALINQGQLQIRNGAVGEGRSAFLRVLEAEPDNWFGHNFLAKIYLSSGAPKMALPHLEKLQQIAPKNSEGNFLWAFYWQQLGDPAKAAAYAEKSKTWRPSDPELRNLLGNIYYRLGRENEALEEYSAAFKLAPDRVDFKANYETLARKLRP